MQKEPPYMLDPPFLVKHPKTGWFVLFFSQLLQKMNLDC